MTRKPGAISGRNLDPKRTRRNQQKATITTGDKLLPPLREDAQGRLSIKKLARVSDSDGTAADTSSKLNELLGYLREQGYMD